MATTDPFLPKKSVLDLVERVVMSPPPQIVNFTDTTYSNFIEIQNKDMDVSLYGYKVGHPSDFLTLLTNASKNKLVTCISLPISFKGTVKTSLEIVGLTYATKNTLDPNRSDIHVLGMGTVLLNEESIIFIGQMYFCIKYGIDLEYEVDLKGKLNYYGL